MNTQQTFTDDTNILLAVELAIQKSDKRYHNELGVEMLADLADILGYVELNDVDPKYKVTYEKIVDAGLQNKCEELFFDPEFTDKQLMHLVTSVLATFKIVYKELR